LAKRYSKYESQVRKELISWLQEKYPNCFISKKPIKICLSERKIPDKEEYLSPDIDVLVYCESTNKLISFEVKAPTYTYKDYYVIKRNGKKVGHQAYKGTLGRLSLEEYTIEKIPRPHKPDLEIVYKGIREALFNLRYVDQSFLVLPDFLYLFRHFHQLFLNILLNRLFPIGLVKCDFSFPSEKKLEDKEFPGERLEVKKFTKIYEAKDSILWQEYEKIIDREKTGFGKQRIRDIRTYLIKEAKSNRM